MNLTLTRPLVVLDLETTSADPKTARIVEASFTLYTMSDDRERMLDTTKTRRLNPGIPIPPEATAIHGITDADVADCPQFGTVAKSLLEFLDGADLAGFNLKRFDLKVLDAEFARCGLEFPLAGRTILDVCVMFHQLQPRDLAAAVKHYLGAPEFAAHSAAGDVSATAEVLDAMLVRHDLPRTVADLGAAFTDPDAIDIDGCFARRGSDIVFAFGKHEGRPIREHAGYLRWMLGESFLSDTKQIAKDTLSTLKE